MREAIYIEEETETGVRNAQHSVLQFRAKTPSVLSNNAD